MTDRAKLFIPVKWRYAGPMPADSFPICIDTRTQRDGTDRFVVVTHFGDVLNRDNDFEWEPQPSSRTDEFIARTRFASFDEAAAAFSEHVRERSVPPVDAERGTNESA